MDEVLPSNASLVKGPDDLTSAAFVKFHLSNAVFHIMDILVKGAGEGRITDAAVEQLRSRVGIEIGSLRAGYTEVTSDAIVNHCQGIGELDPLYRDRYYGLDTRWGAHVAPPSFLRHVGDGLTPRGADRPPKITGGDPIAGVHGFFGGVDLTCFRPIMAGERFRVRGGLSDVSRKDSQMGGVAVHETYDRLYTDADGAPVALARDLHIRIERGAARERKSLHRDDIPKSYTPDEIAAFDEHYEREYTRGAEPRYVEDVTVGDASVPLPKGPYTVSSFVAYVAGSGLLRSNFHTVHGEAYQRRKRQPMGFPLNSLGVPDNVAAVHWERDLALSAGVPERYDAGAERVAWTTQAVTHWMGDDAFMHRFTASVRGFLYVGDTLLITCTVVEKLSGSAGSGVRLALSGTTQRGDQVVTGDAEVLLPSREHGPVKVPVAPTGRVSVFDGATAG